MMLGSTNCENQFYIHVYQICSTGELQGKPSLYVRTWMWRFASRNANHLLCQFGHSLWIIQAAVSVTQRTPSWEVYCVGGHWGVSGVRSPVASKVFIWTLKPSPDLWLGDLKLPVTLKSEKVPSERRGPPIIGKADTVYTQRSVQCYNVDYA